MRNLILTATLLLSLTAHAGPAAHNWYYLFLTVESDSLYIDTKSIVRRGDIYEMPFGVSEKNSTEINSPNDRIQIDLKYRTYKFKSEIEWVEIPNDSFMYMIESYIVVHKHEIPNSEK